MTQHANKERNLTAVLLSLLLVVLVLVVGVFRHLVTILQPDISGNL